MGVAQADKLAEYECLGGHKFFADFGADCPVCGLTLQYATGKYASLPQEDGTHKTYSK
jgi:hypothetical protein